MSSAGLCFDLRALALSVGDGEAGLPRSSEPAVDRFGLLSFARGAGERDDPERAEVTAYQDGVWLGRAIVPVDAIAPGEAPPEWS